MEVTYRPVCVKDGKPLEYRGSIGYTLFHEQCPECDKVYTYRYQRGNYTLYQPNMTLEA